MFTSLGFGQAPIWTNSTAGTGDNSDKFYVIKSDGLDNIYSAGYTFQNNTNWDYFLIKMNLSGDTVWTRTYKGTGNGIDKITFMEVTNEGDIFITGVTNGIGTGDDITTIKYNTSGDLLWVSTYNYSPFNEDEFPSGIEVNLAGEVYVTGSSDRDSSATTNNDFVTIKYNTSGVQQWVIRYNGLGNGTDESAGIVLDNLENPIVIGRTNVGGTNDNMLTIKYTPAGTISWTANFDRGFGLDDEGLAIISDASGNIIVSGLSNNNSDDDIAVVKYNSAGIQQYASYYNNIQNDYPDALALGSFGSVYVAGHTDVLPGAGGDYDYVVLKYNTSGALQWNTIYGNPINKDDDPSDIVVDGSNNVYITGKSDSGLADIKYFNWLTIKLNNLGAFVWSDYHFGDLVNSDDSGEGMIIKSGELYIVGTTQNNTTQRDAALIKINASTGIKSLQKTYNGTGDFTDKTNALFTDKTNNVYSTGYVMQAEQGKNIFVKKINPAGVTQWYKTFNYYNEDEEGNSITVDTSGIIYIAGYSNGNGSGDDYILMKLNTLGDSLWTRRYDYVTENDIAVSVTANTAGTAIFITGYSDASVTSNKNWDIVTIKYNNAGIQQALARYNSPSNGPEKPVRIIFNSNALFVGGTTWNGTNNDLIAIKYNVSLSQLYLSTYSADVSSIENANDIAVDAGNAYIVGSSFSASQLENYAVAKFNSTGILLWSNYYNNILSLNDKPIAICANTTGAFVTGRSATSITDSADITTIKFDKTTGVINWINKYNNITNSDDRGSAIRFDNFNNIIVGGRSTNASGNFDIIIIGYNNSGNRKYIARYDGLGFEDDFNTALGLSTEGYLYAAGHTTNLNSDLDVTALKYCLPAFANAGPDVTICNGKSSTLNATGGLTYLWSPATGLNNTVIANPVAKPTSTTTYIVTVDNGLGCGTTTDTVIVTVNPAPSASITASGATTICLGFSVTLTANAGVGYTYQWFNGATAIPGATSISYIATTTAAYKVEVFNTFGCSKKSKATNVTTIICDEGSEIISGETSITVAPVPFSGYSNLNISVVEEVDVSYIIYNVLGQIEETNNNCETGKTIQIGDKLPVGVYFLEVTYGFKKQTIKIIKTN